MRQPQDRRETLLLHVQIRKQRPQMDVTPAARLSLAPWAPVCPRPVLNVCPQRF